MENSVAVAHSAPSGGPRVAFERVEPFVHVLAADQLLPALCPLCAAPGAVSVPIPYQHPASKNGEVVEILRGSVEAHYCEICAESLSRSDTVRVALIATVVVLCAAVATALPLAYGSRSLVLQVLLTVGMALTPWLFRRTKWGEPVDRGVWLGAPSEDLRRDALLVFTRTMKFSDALTKASITRAPFSRGLIQSDPPFRFVGWLALGSLVWLTTIHHFGVAQVRVLVGGEESATLFSDSRKLFDVAAANSEDPRSGRLFSLLGGRRRLQLVRADGSEVFDLTQNIWPGETYLVGDLPEGKCLFLEERSYGAAGPHNVFVPLGSTGPVFRLKAEIDSWFVPLGAPADDEPVVVTSGGIRRALRLLPCGARL